MSLHSLPTKLLLTILSLLLVFVGIFYFLNKTPQTAEAWYSSSYEHRRPISVSNSSGGSLTNADVLITLDTASLISAGKMQADCDDLRLVDSDDTTLLSYWIEAGCNTSTTQIWARIPSLLSVGETIFAYYDNSAATNGQASWTGNFQVLSTVTCPAGWTRNSTLDNRIPYGNTTYGSTGGSDSYTPAAEVRATGAASAGVIYRSGGGGTIYTSTHTHNITMTLAGASILPPYVGMFFCYSPQLNLYTYAVTLYTTTPSTNRTRFSTLDNRFPRGASSYGAIGAGTTHFHSDFAGPAVIQRVKFSPLDDLTNWMDWLNRILGISFQAHASRGEIVYGNEAGKLMRIPYRKFSSDDALLGAEAEYRTNFPVD